MCPTTTWQRVAKDSKTDKDGDHVHDFGSQALSSFKCTSQGQSSISRKLENAGLPNLDTKT
eukprot:scaffold9948_cov129-Cylindrotheca_fusiformis.AAC.12